MEADWVETTLGEIIELKRGYDLPKSRRNPGDVPIISSSGESDTHSIAKVSGPGVVTGRYGTIGKVFYSESDFWPLNTTLYVRDFKGNNQKFIYYFLKTIDYLQYSDKAAVPGVNRNHLHLAKVYVPSSIKEQKAIAHILGTLDDKIELNRQMNATLEAMAQALFKSWFVDFDPVIDNALAAGNAIPEPLHARAEARKALGDKRKPLPEAIQNQFPRRFVFDEEMGWVPDGWECLKWKDIAKLEYGKSLKGYRGGKGDIPVFGTNGKVGFTEKALCKREGVIIGRKGAYRGVHYSSTAFYVIDTAFYLAPIIPLSIKWAYYEILRFDINGMDSGSAIPSTSRNDFYGLLSLMPNPSLQEEFEKIVSSFYERKEKGSLENARLEMVRDTLLPKLLSGQLRIPDAEKLLAEAI